jgi:hydroxyethylthiazole kinase-like uncharacterized protein yjeF
MLWLIDTDPASRPLFDTAATRRIERAALARVPPGTLVRRAGLAVAKLALALQPHARRVWVAAGPGNNGADGLEAAARLQAAGLQTHVHLVAERARLGPDAGEALARALAAGVDVIDGAPAEPPACDVAIDALLGLGLSRAPEGALAQAIAAINRIAAPRLAVDLPSGLDADRGVAPGAAVVATHTLTMLTLKPGLFTAQGRDFAGRVWLADLDESEVAEPPTAWLTGDDGPAPPRRHAQHKGSFGDVVVVGGAAGMVGAAWLAARAALAAGAGRVYVSLLDAAAPHWHAAHPELMGRERVWTEHVPLLRAATVVCGCGGGDAVRAALPTLLGAAPRLVLDADALNAIAADASLRTLLRARRDRGTPTVLTPHPLEAGRLLGRSAADVQADRLAAAQALADGEGAVVVLKGSGTVTAAPACPPWVNRSGNAALATAGTGDVLAGWLGGRWAAQGAPDLASLQRQCADVVARHGRAADRHGSATALRAGMLVEAMLDA